MGRTLGHSRYLYWWSLRSRLVTGALLGLLPIAVLLSFLWTGARERDREDALRSLVQTTTAVAVIADDLFSEAAALGQAAATAPPVQTLDPAQFTPRIQQLAASNPNVFNILVVDASGTVLGWSSPQPLPTAALSVAGRRFFQQVMATGKVDTVEVIPNANVGVIPGGVAVPIIASGAAPDRPGPPIGLIAVNLDAQHIADRLSEIQLYSGQIVSLLDPTGRIAVQVRPATDLPALTWEQRDRSALPEVQAAMAGTLTTSSKYHTPVPIGADEDRLAVFASTPRFHWVVSTTWPVAEALSGAMRAQTRDLTIFALIVLVILGGALITSRALIVPLRRLSDQARAFADGQFEPIPQGSSTDEIGDLTATFNLMGTRLQRTLDDLRQEQRQLSTVLRQLPVGVAIRSAPGGELILGNDEAERIWKLSFVPQTVLDPDGPATGFYADGRPYNLYEWPIFRALHQGEHIRDEEIIFRRKDGSTGTLSVRAAPIRDESGQIIAAVSSFDDITAQRALDARLREREELLRNLLAQFPASVAIVDKDLRYVLVAGHRVLETAVPPDQLVGHTLDELYSKQLVELARTHAVRALDGEQVSYEVTEQSRCLQVTMLPLRNAHGAIEHILSVTHDITEERAQFDRSVRDEKLHALGQMAGGIAHNLNQMLALVSGYAELALEALERTPANHDEVRRMIQIMEHAAYDGGETVKQLLTFARGQNSQRPKPVDIAALLHEVEDLSRPRWEDATRAEGRPVQLTVSAEPGLVVSGTQSALREALLNLIFNALEAMPTGGEIRLRAYRAEEYAHIDVEDTGTGMTAEVRQKIFEPFFTTKGEQGTGLGLAMVFGIVQHHGGQIDVTSEPGRGTTMHLRFPTAEPEQPAHPAASQHKTASRLRVLVADDELRLAALAAGMLRRDGHEVTEVGSGEDACEIIATQPLDLVITDLSMGDGMNGWDVAARAGEVAPGLPVVLATGWGAAIDPEAARQRGVHTVLAKPFRIADLREIVARVDQVRAQPVRHNERAAASG